MVQKRVDSHVHFLVSKSQAMSDWDAIGNILAIAKIAGLDALCVTEHIEAKAYESLMLGIFRDNNLNGTMHSDGVVEVDGVSLLPAAELELQNGTNVGVHTNFDTLISLTRESGAYTLESLHRALSQRERPFKLVAHHIFWPGKTCDDLLELGRYVNAIEVPAKDLANAEKYMALAKDLELATTGGSDAHTFIQVGACHTTFDMSATSSCISTSWIECKKTSHIYNEFSPRLVAMAKIHRKTLIA